MIKRKKPKKVAKKKQSLKVVKARIWRKFSDFIKKRDGNKCFVCGATGLSGSNWHAAHCFSAGLYPALRWRLDNCFSGCYSCNVGKHGNYIEYHRKYKEKFGEEKYNDLYSRRYDVKQWRIPDLEEVEAEIDSHLSAVPSK